MNKDCLRKSKMVSTNTIEGISFVYLEDTKEVIKLDEVASFIWNQIDGIRKNSEIIDNCIDFFEGNPCEIRTSVSEFFDTLISEKLTEKESR